MTTSAIEITRRAPQTAAVVRGRVALADVPAFVTGAFGEVAEALSGAGVPLTGPPFTRYRLVDGEFDLEAGFPCGGEAPRSGRVRPATLPGGSVAIAEHRGDYGDVAATYAAVTTWVGEHGWAPAGAPWETYLDDPEVPDPRTAVSFPVRRP